jgi:hypothetical protein
VDSTAKDNVIADQDTSVVKVAAVTVAVIKTVECDNVCIERGVRGQGVITGR